MREEVERNVFSNGFDRFLGSGKTTLLNHILSSTEHKMKFAIIENRFGDIGIDENILVESSGKYNRGHEWLYMLHCQGISQIYWIKCTESQRL